jgi:pyridoxal phosphate enzyme (YggS family)
VDKAYLIHSVDSLRLAQEISKEAVKKNVKANILIEVNVANEETKFGTTCEEVKNLVKEIAKLPNIFIKGLMTIAPIVENAEENRIFFSKLNELAVDIDKENIDNVDMRILSMGMTGDYPVAVSEGATFVRVGTGIFGARDYTMTEGKEK